MVDKRDFLVKSVTFQKLGMGFSVDWKETHYIGEEIPTFVNKEDMDTYELVNSRNGFSFNNCVPSQIGKELGEHVRNICMHSEDIRIEVRSVAISKYGKGGNENYVVKFKYAYGSPALDELSSATTGKLFLVKERYDKADEVLDLIKRLEDNLYNFLIHGEKFRPEEKVFEFKGNVMDMSA